MDNEATAKIVYEFPKEEFDAFLEEIRNITRQPIPGERAVIEAPKRIHAYEFSIQIGVGRTVLGQMIAGKHPSGFTLKTFKKEGSQQVWTLQTEVERYFEGFGSEAKLRE